MRSTETSPYRARDSVNSRVGPGEEQLVERTAAGRALAGQTLLLLVGERLHRRLVGAALERLGAERLRPAARRVAELAVEEPDDGVRDVELARVRRRTLPGRRRRRPARAPGRRSPWRTGSPWGCGRGCRWPRRTCPRSARTSRRGRARSPAGAGWTAGRRGSRGGRRARSARAGRTRTARRPGGSPPSRARAR